MSFERENRYFVFKRSDHTPQAITMLERLSETRDILRGLAGKSPLVCAVVEQDWPEYETVWSMVQGRVEAEQAERPVKFAPELAAPYGESQSQEDLWADPYQHMAFAVFGGRED